MTTKRWLLFLSTLMVAGLFVWLQASLQRQAEAQPKPEAGAGVHGSVFVQVAALPDKGRREEQILLPDFEIALKNLKTSNLSKPQKTDLFGRYRFPPLEPGTYKLVWKKQNGWDEGEHPDQIVVTKNTQYPTPAEAKPQKGLAVVMGRVRLGDGGSPWFASEFFGVLRFAEVTLLDPAGKTIAGPARANFAGDYAIAALAKPDYRIESNSGSAKASGVLTSAYFLGNNNLKPLDLKLNNQRPRLDAVVTVLGGQPVRHADPGVTVQIIVTAKDPDNDPLTFMWKTDSGTINGNGASVDWKLPGKAGVCTAYVLISDGRGGDTQGQVIITVGAKGDTFNGRAIDPNGKPVVQATVTVNSTKPVLTDSNGFFSVPVPPSDRYVLNIHKTGFAPLSRLFDRPTNGHTWKLVPAQMTEVDPTKPIDVVDRRPILDKRNRRGAQVQVPANALVDADGNKPAGKLKAAIATLDLSNDEAPGDWLAKQGKQDVGLISYGLTFVEFTDVAGKKYNLAPGQKAEVMIPVSASMLAHAPPQIPIWFYDENDGYWKSLGTAALDKLSDSYKGLITHFSTINMDQNGPVSCLAVHSDISIPTGLKLRSSPGTGATFSVTKEVVLDGNLNAVFRIPTGENVKLEVLDDNDNLLPNVIVEDGNTVGTLVNGQLHPLPNNEVTAGPADPNLWPPYPYSNCKPVTLKLNALWSGYPSSPFFTYLGTGDATSANGYYQTIDPPAPAAGFPNGRRTTLSDWWKLNGFDSSGSAPAGPNYARTSYLNNNDLGSGRDMHFLRGPNGRLAAYVTNYSRGGAFDQNPVFADDALNQNQPGATVCMEYSPVEGDPTNTKIVKFFVFAGGTRANAADLDGFGGKFVPNLCTTCHGGAFYSAADPAHPTLAEVNTSSSFRELDVATYKFPGFRTTPNQPEQDAFKQQNQLISSTSAARQPILDLIAGWYAPNGSGTTQDNNYTPTNWQGSPQQGLYHDVVKRSCRTCHIAFNSDDNQNGLDWNRYDQLKLRRTSGLLQAYAIGTTISPPSSRVMPHALVTYRNFWLDQIPAHRPKKLWEYSDPPGWLPIGPPGP